MQQQLGAQCTCFTSFTVAGEQGAPERAVAPDAAAARCSVCLLYWYKSANTDTRGGAALDRETLELSTKRDSKAREYAKSVANRRDAEQAVFFFSIAIFFWR